MHALLQDPVCSVVDIDQIEARQAEVFSDALRDSLPRSFKGGSVVVRAGEVCIAGEVKIVPKVTLDSGAQGASYCGEAMLQRLGAVVRLPCQHKDQIGYIREGLLAPTDLRCGQRPHRAALD